jgi:hypothetical protein
MPPRAFKPTVPVLALVAVAACTPDIASGSYLCGPEQDCPDGQKCDGATNTCVLPAQASAFACDPTVEHEPDDTPSQGFSIAGLTCTSSPFLAHGCLAAGDGQDWFQVPVPAACAAVAIDLQVSFPVAFEPLSVDLFDATGATSVASGAACVHRTTIGPGDDGACIHATLSPGATYALQIHPAGGGDCGGGCNYNRYTLTLTLGTP